MPASGCEIIANVRREAIWSASGATGVLSMGAPAAKCAEKRLEKRANAYEQCIISQAERGGATSNKIPDKSTFSNACAIFSCKAQTKRAIFEMHPLRLIQPFLKPAWGTHPATLAYESRTARRRVTCWFIFSITTEYEDASRAEWFLLPFRAFVRPCGVLHRLTTLQSLAAISPQPVSLSPAPPRSCAPIASSRPLEGAP